jgi:hypothetical protein
MRWAVAAFPLYFRPSVTAGDMAGDVGLGMYTCAGPADLNLTALEKFGGNVIWDAHFWWPYQGCFQARISFI